MKRSSDSGRVANIHVGADEYGKYLITSIVHQTDGSGNYHNFFNAIPNTVDCPPMASAIEPVTELETATVVDNKDPDKFGRLQVKLRWQTGSGADALAAQRVAVHRSPSRN
jgi:hypothetical protein